MTIKTRIDGFCFHSKQDLLLSKQEYINGEPIWHTWIPNSKWDWTKEPTNRQIMSNEIVWETDFDKETNLELTKQMLAILDRLEMSYWVYFTGSKSYHIHFILNGLENIEDGKERQYIKETVSKNFLGTELYSKVDVNNFAPKRLIRIEGSVHPKTGLNSELFSKREYADNEDKQKAVLKHALELMLIEQSNKAKAKYLNSLNLVDNSKIYCMLMEHAITTKFPEGGRHMNLCPNAVAILNEKQLSELADTQGMKASEFVGWIQKKPQFNCIQFRRYSVTIGKKDICMHCMRNSFDKNNG
jgi:hypothetical protein